VVRYAFTVRLFHSLHLAGSMLAHRVGATTRHPRMGAVEEPEVALREPQSNQQLRRKTPLSGCCAGTLWLLWGNHRGISVACVIDAQRWRMGCSSNAEIIAGTVAVLRTGRMLTLHPLRGRVEAENGSGRKRQHMQ
jgi:hypothetical protein